MDGVLGGFFEVDRSSGVNRPVAVWPHWVEAFEMTPQQAAGHPLVQHYRARPGAAPCTLDDVPDLRGWRTAPAYASAREQFGQVDRHAAVPVGQGPGTTRILTVGRPGRNFGAAEKAFLARAQPVLLALDGHARTVMRHQENIRRKLGTADRLNTVLRAQRLGIVGRS